MDLVLKPQWLLSYWIEGSTTSEMWKSKKKKKKKERKIMDFSIVFVKGSVEIE